MISLKATSPQQGGVTLLWEEGHQDFEVEAVAIASLNLLTFQLVTGEERYFVMGAHIPPADTTGVDDLRVAWAARPTNCKPLLLGELNIDFRAPRTGRRSLRISSTKSTSSTCRARTFSARVADRDEGHGGLGGSRGGGGGTNPGQITLWPGRKTRRHFGMWQFGDRGSTIRTIAPPSPEF